MKKNQTVEEIIEEECEKWTDWDDLSEEDQDETREGYYRVPQTRDMEVAELKNDRSFHMGCASESTKLAKETIKDLILLQTQLDICSKALEFFVGEEKILFENTPQGLKEKRFKPADEALSQVKGRGDTA